MPHWGMGKGIQNVVNSWVNVNHNHNAANHIAGKSGNDGTQRTTGSSAATNQPLQHGSIGFSSPAAIHEQARPQGVIGTASEPTNARHVPVYPGIHQDRNSSTGISSTEVASLGRGANPLPILFGSKQRGGQTKNSGKLKRTNSQSDLLKERAARRSSTSHAPKDQNFRKPIIGGNSDVMLFGMLPTRNIMDDRASHNIVVDRGGTHSVTIHSDARRTQKIINTGQYINENAFANQHRSMQLAAQELENMAKLKRGTQLRSQTSSAPPPSISPEDAARDTSERRQSLPESTKFPALPLEGQSATNVQPTSTASLAASVTKNGATTTMNSDESSSCSQCHDLKSQILALEADLEYMRSAALNSEYVCVSCERRNMSNPTNSASSVASSRSIRSSRSKHSMASSRMLDASQHSHSAKSISRKVRQTGSQFLQDNFALAQASRRLVDLTARHKRQIEHMSKEMGRWQNDMHLKLSKLAMMCKDLNDESAKRKEQADVAKQDLETVREERNALSSELEILKARIALYEKQEAENVHIRQLLRENQNETISMADQAIAERDAIIEDLTLQLEQSLDLLSRDKK